MHKFLKSSAAAAMAAVFAVSALPAAAVDQAAIDKLHAQAIAIAIQPGENLRNIAWLCDYNNRPGRLVAGGDPAPISIFDNMYFVGTGHVSSWLIKTSAGLILFDTLDNSQEADQFILGGIKALGFNPQDVKYIVVTHAHADHYGGAKELQTKIPGVHVIMGPKDWNILATNPPKPHPGVAAAPIPKHDMDATNGMKVTLGDETVTLYATPGHTPGTLSAIIPVKDRGKAMNIALWGGQPYNAKEDETAFMASVDMFNKVMADAHVAGRLSNHAIWDNGIAKLYARANDPTGPSPYLETQSDLDRYAKIQRICLQAQHVRLNSK